MEFLSRTATFYFIEMNARLQVEHPVTELTTGLDLDRLAAAHRRGREATVARTTSTPRGHAIEFRIYAEDPVKFFPSPGR